MAPSDIQLDTEEIQVEGGYSISLEGDHYKDRLDSVPQDSSRLLT